AGADHADAFQPGAEAVQDTGQDESADRNAEHRDAGDRSRLGVAADREQVLTKGGLVPDEPDDHDRRNGPQDNGGESADLGDDHAGDGGLDGAEGNALGGIGNQTEDDQHVRHGRDERVHLEFGREETGNGGKNRAQYNTDDQCQEHTGQDRQAGEIKHMAEHRAGVDTLMHDDGGGGHAHTDHTANGQVRTGQQDQAGDAQCQEHTRRRLLQDVQDVVHREQLHVLDDGGD